MIRPYHANDTNAVLDIWLSASIQAHAFIDESFWRDQLTAMGEIYLPQAETLVLEEAGQTLGFASLHEHRLAALFIAPGAQGRGLGKRLLNEAKCRRDLLELSVYSANTRACVFYQTCGFAVVAEQNDPHTGHPEQVMRWQRE
ncbi:MULTISPECIES: N-acetyltransferase [Pseudomonas]|uniref:GCN5-related N-acetyltransferase n=1 Tax=Pseudomonas fulva (strain 12-X) TaxID=743720 RepID=F6AII5_PSEF1|nr:MULTISPECIES: N-acetyltransferase [Pseudomonas]AEF20573.1 GCN5-related N-acetyltransferase [Pseudomonas fulva 12-X]